MIKSACCKELKLKVAWKKDGFLFSLNERDTVYRISKVFHECDKCGYRTNIMHRIAKEENTWVKEDGLYFYKLVNDKFVVSGERKE